MPSLVYHCPTWKFLACKALDWAWPGVYYSPLAPGRLVDLPPVNPLPQGWARIRIRQCGLCASELPILHLDLSPSIAPSAMFDAAHSTVLGHELLGEIIETDAQCPLQIGQRVISRSGGFRNCFNLGVTPCRYCQSGEYALCLNQDAPPPPFEPIRAGGFSPIYEEHHANLLPVPDEMSDDEAALVEPLACSLRAVLKLGAQPIHRVLVIGAGIQGLGAVHWLSTLLHPEHLSVVARYPFQADLATRLGATHVLQGHVDTQRLAAHLNTRLIKGIGKNQLLADGFDAVIDAVGSPTTFNQALRWAKPGGQVVLLGAHLHAGRLDYSPIWFREVEAKGVYAHGLEHFEGRSIQTMQLVIDLLQSHCKLPVNLATHHLPLADYRHAIELMKHKSVSKAGKVMLKP